MRPPAPDRRHHPAGATLAAAALILVGCGQDPGGATTSTSTSTSEDDTMSSSTPAGHDEQESASTADTTSLSIEATATLGGPTAPGLDPTSQGLSVTYEVRNDGTEPVLVARERGHSQDTSSFGPDNAESVWVREDGDVLRLSKELVPLPEGTMEESETTLPAELLQPGDTLEGTAFALLPVSVDFPDAPQRGERIEPLPSTWQLCLTTAPVDTEVGRTDVIGRHTPALTTICSDPAAVPEDLPGR